MAYQFIDATECLGDSLFKINNNAASFDTRIDAINTLIPSVSSQLVPVYLSFTSPSTSPYTVIASDVSKTILMNFSTPNTINLPSGLQVGFQVSVVQTGTGQTTFAATGGTTLRHPDNFTKIYKQWSAASAIFLGSNNWLLAGDLIS